MPGRKRTERKREYLPKSLVKQIEKEMRNINATTRIEAMESIARKLDEIVIKKRNFNKK